MPVFYSRLALSAGLLLTTLFSARAQTTTFERHFGTRSSLDDFRSVQPTADGGYVALGTTANRTHGNTDLWLVKTNAAGDTLFTRRYGGPQAETGTTVQQTPDGGYLLAGTTTGSSGAGREDFLVVRVSATGAQQWQQTFGSADREFCTSMALTSDGGAVLAGRQQTQRSNGTIHNEIFLVRINALGTQLWRDALSTTSINGEQAHAIEQTTDGGFIVAGEEGYEENDVLVRLNAQGVVTWRRNYASATGTGGAAVCVQQTADGGYVVGGTYIDYNTSTVAARVTKTTALGVATRTYDVPGTNEYVRAIRQTADGGFAILTNLYDANPELSKVSAAWQRVFAHSIPAGTAQQRIQALSLAPNGSFVLAGYSTQLSTGGEGRLVRYSAAGNLELQRDYGTEGGTGYEAGRTVAATPDGGGVVLSEEFLDAQSDTIAFRLTKLSASGLSQWTTVVTNPTVSTATAASVCATPDGGYLITANGYDYATGQTHLIKTSSQGAVQWRKSFPATNSPAIFGKAIPTTDGGYALLTGLPGASSSFDMRVWLLKLSATGDTTWTRKFGAPGSASNGYDLVQTADGGFAFAGRTSPGVRQQQAWVVRTTATGQTLWSRHFGRARADRVSSIQQTTDGGFILAGYSTDPTTQLAQGLLLKLSAAGDSTWARLLSPASAFTFAYRALQTADGGYVVSDVINPDPYDYTTRYARLLKTDAAGSLVWQQSFGVNRVPLIYGLEASADGGFLAVGSQVTIHGDLDVYVVKTDGSGNVLSSRPAAAQPDVQLYPNPARATTRLQLPAALRTGPLQLTLHDPLGRIVRQWALPAGSAADVPLDVRSLARGTYLLRISGGPADRRQLSRRLVLE